MLHRFSRLRVDGYRRLRQVDVNLQPLTLLIGPNGVGKTSYLEVFSLLAASCRGQLSSRMSELGGLPDIITRDRAECLRFQIEMTVADHHPLEYELEIRPRGVAHTISKEQLSQRHPGKAKPMLHLSSIGTNVRYFDPSAKKLLAPTWEHNHQETALAQCLKTFQSSENLRASLASSTSFAALNVAPNAPVRLPQMMRPASDPGTNGESLVSCLYTLRESERERFEMIEDSLRVAFPDFERLDFPPVAAGSLAMTWKDRSFSRPLYMHQLSEGTLRYLWLLTLLASKELPTFTLLDEPEVSLHPEMLMLLLDQLREASRRTHLVVATHSDTLLRFAKPEEVLVFDLEEGEAKLTPGNKLDLERWLHEYSLDELWRMGRLGGRPYWLVDRAKVASAS